MRHSIFTVTAAAVLGLADAAGTSAQSHEIPQLNSCIKEFYDPGMYNYLTYKNNCAQSLTVVYVAKDNSGFTGMLELRPGASDSVGRSARGVVPKVGGFELYVCQSGYVPVDENNKLVDKPHATFECKPKPQ